MLTDGDVGLEESIITSVLKMLAGSNMACRGRAIRILKIPIPGFAIFELSVRLGSSKLRLDPNSSPEKILESSRPRTQPENLSSID